MTEDREYPRWVHAPGSIPGKKSKLVNNAEEEAAQVALWAEDAGEPATGNALIVGQWRPDTERAERYANATSIETVAVDPALIETPVLPQLDHDGNGKPGGSKKGGWPKGKPRTPKAQS